MNFGDPALVTLVNGLRILMTLSWFGVFLKLFGPATRAIRRPAGDGDDYVLLHWCFSILMLSFGIRWFLFPQAMKAMVAPELILWASTYFFAAVLGRAVFNAVRPHGR